MSEAGGHPGGEPGRRMSTGIIGTDSTAGTPQATPAAASTRIRPQTPSGSGYGYGYGHGGSPSHGASQYQPPYATQRPQQFQRPQSQPAQPYMPQPPYSAPQWQAGNASTSKTANRKPRRITTVMLACAIACGLVQPAFIYEGMSAWHSDIGMFWSLIGLVTGAALPFLLRERDEKPEFVCLIVAIVTICLPISPLTALMTQSALIARREPDRCIYGLIALSSAATVISRLRDALMPAEYSIIGTMLSSTNDQGDVIHAASRQGMLLAGLLLAVISIAIAVIVGVANRNTSRAQRAQRQAAQQQDRAQMLQSDLASQQLADAIATEAHDTLAHSLSLIAVNASALQVQCGTLTAGNITDQQVHDIAQRAEDIRKQAAGALDEAHSIIDLLRNPNKARQTLGPDDATSLSRESLSSLIAEARAAGAHIDTWIDIQDMGAIDPDVTKIAYRTVQEGLTNARRHAPGQPIELEVTCSAAHGINVHISNPTGIQAPEHTADNGNGIKAEREPMGGPAGGNGLRGVRERVAAVGGTCTWGTDKRSVFHLKVSLPPRSVQRQPGDA
ncbi:sensor histidine kinase [Bifidobacterium apri]